MSLLDKASLIITPNAYKESKLYSVVPNTTLGDMDVVRATTATRVNSDGLIEQVPYNFAQYSEQFNNGAWAKSDIIISANAIIAPNGSTTADKIIANTNNAAHAIYQAIPRGTYSFSIYAKAGEETLFSMWLSDFSKRAVFDLSNGTIIGSNVTNSTITDEGNGWYRCSVYDNSLTEYIALYGKNGTSYVGNGVDGFYLWGAQAEQSTSAKEYFPTTDRLNVPRLDYTNSSCPSILVEPQRTNLVTYSEQFDNISWIKLNVSITANTAVSPDGNTNADAVIPNTNNGIHALRSNLFNQSATTSHSWFVKANGYSKVAVRESELVGNYAAFDLLNGTLLSTNQTGSIVNYGNGWYRCTLVDTTTGAGSQTSIVVLPDSYTTGNPLFNWIPDGVKGVLAYGATAEIGSYATSYVPTIATAVTRNADVISKTGISSLIGQTEGTMFVDFNISEIEPNPSYLMVANLSNGDIDNRLGFARQPNGGIHIYVVSGGVGQFTFNTTQTTGLFRLAITYKANDYAIYLNGTNIYTNTSASVPSSLSRFDLGHLLTDFVSKVRINSAQLYKTRLSNSELAQLTTL